MAGQRGVKREVRIAIPRPRDDPGSPVIAPSPDPRVSAIVVTHNRPRFLFAAVSSVLRQTLASIEVVIVDDGSTDDTPAVAAHGKSRGVAWTGPAQQSGLLDARGWHAHARSRRHPTPLRPSRGPGPAPRAQRPAPPPGQRLCPFGSRRAGHWRVRPSAWDTAPSPANAQIRQAVRKTSVLGWFACRARSPAATVQNTTAHSPVTTPRRRVRPAPQKPTSVANAVRTPSTAAVATRGTRPTPGDPATLPRHPKTSSCARHPRSSMGPPRQGRTGAPQSEPRILEKG